MTLLRYWSFPCCLFAGSELQMGGVKMLPDAGRLEVHYNSTELHTYFLDLNMFRVVGSR